MSETARIAEIEKQLIEQYSNKKSRWANLGLLVLSMLLFVSFGLLRDAFSGIITLVIVILIHEVGHFVGMKIFGYRNFNIFFIPFLGAATSGIETNHSGTKKAIISLLGPIPGIIIGVVLGFLYFKTKNDFYVQPARMFLFINAFNLLPFLPLDGGRFINNVLFPRNLKIEIVSKIISGLSLIGVAYLLKSFLLGGFAIGFLISIKGTFHIGTIAKQLREKIVPEERILSIDVQRKYIPEINTILDKKLSIKPSPREIAKHIINIWQRLSNFPPKKGAAFGLASFYLVMIIAAVIVTFVFEAGVAYSKTERKIELYETSDGIKKKREVYFYQGKYLGYTEVSENNLYHGKSENFYVDTGKIKRRGQWSNGKWDGEWFDYDQNGNAIRETKLIEGRLIYIRELQKDGWIEKNLDDLPKFIRMPYVKHENGPPEGPRTKKDQESS